MLPILMLLGGVGISELEGVERLGGFGVLALIAWLFWQKLERSDQAKLEMHREQLELQKDHAEVLRKMAVESVQVEQEVSKDIKHLISVLKTRPCLCEDLLERKKK